MVTVYTKATCSCCINALHFKDRISAAKAFKKAGSRFSVTIIDSDAQSLDCDTTSGYWFDSREERPSNEAEEDDLVNYKENNDEEEEYWDDDNGEGKDE